MSKSILLGFAMAAALSAYATGAPAAVQTKDVNCAQCAGVAIAVRSSTTVVRSGPRRTTVVRRRGPRRTTVVRRRPSSTTVIHRH